MTRKEERKHKGTKGQRKNNLYIFLSLCLTIHYKETL